MPAVAIPPLELSSAATTIQAHARGKVTRQRTQLLREELLRTRHMEPAATPAAAPNASASGVAVPLLEIDKAAMTIQSHVRGKVAREKTGLRRDELLRTRHIEAAAAPVPAALAPPTPPKPKPAPKGAAARVKIDPSTIRLPQETSSFGQAVPLMLARRAQRKKIRSLSSNERADRERGWNEKKFNSTPPTLKGIKLSRKEPWDDDANYFSDLLTQQDPFSLDNTSHVRYWESSARDVWIEEGWSKERRGRALARKSEKEMARPWDGSILHATPYLLWGLKPVTPEQWDRDQKIRKKNDPDKKRKERIRKGVPNPYEAQAREAESMVTPRFGWFGGSPAAAPAPAPAPASDSVASGAPMSTALVVRSRPGSSLRFGTPTSTARSLTPTSPARSPTPKSPASSLTPKSPSRPATSASVQHTPTRKEAMSAKERQRKKQAERDEAATRLQAIQRGRKSRQSFARTDPKPAALGGLFGWFGVGSSKSKLPPPKPKTGIWSVAAAAPTTGGRNDDGMAC